jgi:hemolysin III
LEISASTRRALTLPRPRARGLSHLAAAVLSLPAGVWLALSAPGGTPRLAAGVFGLSVFAMFSASAVVHRRRWSPTTTELLFRLDHTGILLAFAGTATVVALLGLEGWPRSLLLWGVWAGVALGATVVWWPRPTPRGALTGICFLLGAIAVPVVPSLYQQTGWSTVGLLLAGGMLFAVGSAIVGLRRPDPAPASFGYHEIWHLFVIGGISLYYVMVAATLLPAAT